MDPMIMLFGLIGLAILLAALAWYFSDEEVFQDLTLEDAEVTDTDYEASRTTTGVGPTFSGGKVGVGMTSSTSPERHQITMRSETFRYLIVDSEELFDWVHRGDKVKLGYYDVYTRPRRKPEATPVFKEKRLMHIELLAGNKCTNYTVVKSKRN